MLSNLQNLDVFSSRSFVMNNPATTSSLLTWTSELLLDEVKNGGLSPNANKKELTDALNCYLLKKRMVNYVIRKMTVKYSLMPDAEYKANFDTFSKSFQSIKALKKRCASGRWARGGAHVVGEAG